MDRKEKLQMLVETAFSGNQSQFAKAIKKSTAQVNHWLTGHRNLGDAGARHIEIALNLGQGYFDKLNVFSKNQLQDAQLMLSENAADYIQKPPGLPAAVQRTVDLMMTVDEETHQAILDAIKPLVKILKKNK